MDIRVRAQRLLGRQDFRDNPIKAIGVRLVTKIAPKLGATEFSATLDSDIQIRAPYSSSPGKAIRYLGVSEPETLATIRRLLVRGGVFIDVGSHIGEYALISVKQMGPDSVAFAFEPGTEILPYLQANVRNSRYADQIHVSDAAVSDYNGTDVFNLGADPGHSRLESGTVHLKPLATSGVAEVTVLRLDDFLLDRNVEPDLVKIDVEGAECSAIKGMEGLLSQSTSKRPAIIFEYLERTWSEFGNEIEDVIAFLDPFGYSVYGISGDVLTVIRTKQDADSATAGLDLDLLALLPEHVRLGGFEVA